MAPQRQIPSTTPDRSAKYREIGVTTLRLESTIPFILYTQIEGEFLVYRREDLPFTHTQRDALIENGLETLYVSPDQVSLYWEYLSAGIKQILSDEGVPLSERSRILYESSEQLSQRIASAPVAGENVQLAQEVVAGSIEFQKVGKRSLHALMAEMAEEPSIHAHVLNACQYGLGLARELGALHGEDLEAFGMGLMLMDIGMLQIPESLQFKDGPLSFDEWSLIKRHPAIGLELIEGLEGIPELAREVIFGHHERQDGSGYPQGLRGKELGIPMRIVGVVDTFTTLTGLGSHRDPLSTFEAIRKMHTDLLPGLDSEIFHAFIQLLGQDVD